MKAENVIIAWLNLDDYPEFTDAWIAGATIDGEQADETQLQELNEDRDFVNQMAVQAYSERINSFNEL